MAEMPDVVTGNTIASSWGNDIRDRTIQRYASAAQRTTEHGTPAQGDLSFLEDTGDVDVYASGGWQHIGPPAGAIQMWGATAAPAGWLLCNGQAVSRTTYAALFGIYGTTYGTGDGSTTFNLPDSRLRFPLGKNDGNVLGQTGGSINHTHSGPSHTHSNPNTSSTGAHTHTNPATANDTGAGSGSTSPPGSGLVSQRDHNHTQGSTGSNGSHAHTQANTGASGTSNTGSENPPFIVLNFIVKI